VVVSREGFGVTGALLSGGVTGALLSGGVTGRCCRLPSNHSNNDIMWACGVLVMKIYLYRYIFSFLELQEFQ